MVFFTHRPKTWAPEFPEPLVTRETTVCTVASNIYWHNLSFRTEVCIRSYLPSTKRQITQTFTSHSVNARPDCGTFFSFCQYGASNAQVAPRFLENLWARGLRIYQTSTTTSTKCEQITRLLLKLESTPYKKYTGCNRRNGPDFGRVFLMLYYTDITQNTYIQT